MIFSRLDYLKWEVWQLKNEPLDREKTLSSDRIKELENTVVDSLSKMGFDLINPRNWTYSTQEIYLSDMHDENVLRSSSGTVFVVDCDIRINTPQLRAGGTRTLTTDVEIL